MEQLAHPIRSLVEGLRGARSGVLQVLWGATTTLRYLQSLYKGAHRRRTSSRHCPNRSLFFTRPLTGAARDTTPRSQSSVHSLLW